MTLASSENFLFCPAAASCTAFTRSAIRLSVCLNDEYSRETAREQDSPDPELVHPILGRVEVKQVHLLGAQTDGCV